MTSAEAAASRRLVAAATNAAIGSGSSTHVRQYFNDQRAMERALRAPFITLRRRFDDGDQLSSADLIPRLAEVNKRYPTRCATALLPPLAEAILSRLRVEPWWEHRTRPRLFADAKNADSLGCVVPDVLVSLRSGRPGCKRPYSLTSKCLHFLFPDGFAIFDAQAAESVQMWGYFAFPLDHADSLPFGRWSVAQPDGRGYRHLLAFYSRLWTALTADASHRLEGAALSLEPLLGEDGSDRGELVGPLDVLDKHLWKSNGNPVRLGLADVPT